MSTSFDPRIVLRPRSLDESLDLALAYHRTHPRVFARLFATLTAGVLAVAGAATLALSLSPQAQAAWVLVLGAISERVVTAFGGRHLFGNPVTLRGAAAATMRHLPFAIVASTFANLPWLLLILDDYDDPSWAVFGVVLGMFWPFMLATHVYLREVLQLEQLPLWRAMERARSVGSLRFGRAVGLLTLSLAVRLAFATMAVSTVRFAAEFLLQFQQTPEAMTLWAAFAGWTAAGPFLALARLFDYVDARTRREGWDIQVRFNAILHREAQERIAA